MTWTAPMTAVDGDVLTASQFNLYVRNNLNETAVAKATKKNQYFVSNGLNDVQARSAVSGVNAAKIRVEAGSDYAFVHRGGPSVAVTTGTSALVMIGAHAVNEKGLRVSGYGYEVTGATSLPLNVGSSDEGRMSVINDGLGSSVEDSNAIRQSVCFLEDRLNPGTNVFTMKYFQSTSGDDCYYLHREIIVLPL